MAQQIYTGSIDKYTNWGGDASTGNLPVAGGSVQNFIKDTLQDKIGYIYEDRNNNLCLGFADEGDYNLYASDPMRYSDLLIQSWYCYFPPIQPTLEYPMYYGSTQGNITIRDASVLVPSSLTSTSSMSITCNTNNAYVYIALYDEYNISSIVTANSESILSEFINMGVFMLDNKIYKLYEFHLSSGLPLDVNINIQITNV